MTEQGSVADGYHHPIAFSLSNVLAFVFAQPFKNPEAYKHPEVGANVNQWCECDGVDEFDDAQNMTDEIELCSQLHGTKGTTDAEAENLCSLGRCMKDEIFRIKQKIDNEKMALEKVLQKLNVFLLLLAALDAFGKNGAEAKQARVDGEGYGLMGQGDAE